MNVQKEIQKNPFLLAPMAGITNLAFRSFMRELNCGIVTTELVSANGLRFGSEKTRKLMAFEPLQRPVGIQIFGESSENLVFAAQESEQLGADFVDLNLGCPVNKVVKKGAGSAMLKDLVNLQKVLRKMKSAIQIPLTIKIRTGWDEEHKNAIELAQVAYDEGISWVTIHGRTRAQGYSGKSDWNYISKVAQNSKVPIIGNGDITCAKMSNQRLKESGCAAVMIGRGCLKNPWIFKQAQNLRFEKDFQTLFQRLIFFLEKNFDERVALLQVKKMAAWYSAGYPNSSSLRKDLFAIKTRQALYNRVNEYYDEFGSQTPTDTSSEAFLMGGHG